MDIKSFKLGSLVKIKSFEYTRPRFGVNERMSSTYHLVHIVRSVDIKDNKLLLYNRNWLKDFTYAYDPRDLSLMVFGDDKYEVRNFYFNLVLS